MQRRWMPVDCSVSLPGCAPGQAQARNMRASRSPVCSRQAPIACPSRSCSSVSQRSRSQSCLPRLSAGIAYGLVAAGFLSQLLGALLGAPSWLLDLSPFQHVALVPAQPFRAGAASGLLVIAAATAGASLWWFHRRDLTGA
jgi:hypothetical protein